ncbi:glycine oxidase [Propionigenium maris DSM 9537]|uniref:Glycine oxidase n=1 Tax=Propionigenium maris DSM 9537 TaxID=1123000 RepID=A0A9W6GLY3_9FUSO|nr:FAD-dependent oxidoreductase [Propionigenium maris]GLI56848.1 glycine oxidase [Propionigenium maris DSM 9537]
MNSDIIVIGGGVIGTSIAYNLSKNGKKVTLIEKDDHARGASGSSDQLVLMQSKKPGVHLALALESLKMYKTLEEELGEPIHFRQLGGLILIENEDEMKLMEEFVERQRKTGLDVSIISLEEINKLQEGIAQDIIGATYSPMDAEVDPIALNVAFAKAAKREGAEIVLGTEVKDILLEDGKITGVETDSGTYHAPVVINAAGVWAPLLAQKIGFDAPIKPRRGQICITDEVDYFVHMPVLSAKYIMAKHNPDLLKDAPEVVSRLGIGLALSQSPKGNIMFGATREFVGYDKGVTYEGISEVVKNAARYFPKLKDMSIIRTMGGMRPFTPDGLPLIGWTEGIEGFFMAAGHEGDGIALAPVTGRVVSDLILHGETFVDVSGFNPNRFNK